MAGFGQQPFGTSPFGTGTVEGEEPPPPPVGPVTDPIQLAQATPEYKAWQWAAQTQNVVWPSQRRGPGRRRSTAAPTG